MRGPGRVLGISALLVSLSLAGCGLETPPSAPTGEPAAERSFDRPGSVPSWVPPTTPEQRALLNAPMQRNIKAPATRTFPDLGRFGYANNRPLASPDDAVKFTRMVNQVLNDSARFYVLEELPAGAANPIAQYGPPAAEPDGLLVARRGSDGIAQLVPAPGAGEARDALTAGATLLKSGNVEGAIETYRAALGRAPGVPALRVALAAALAQAGRAADAQLAYREALTTDPTFAPAHLGLAELADRRGDRATARRALAEALAYHPPSPRGLALLERLKGGGTSIPVGAPGADGGWYDAPPVVPRQAPRSGAAAGRVTPFPLFLDVDPAGAVHVATDKGDAAQIYGGCRAVMRHEPALRAQIFAQPRDTPYYLTVAEEVVCLEAGLGAYLSGRDGEPSRGSPNPSGGDKADPNLDQLLRIAREDGLSGYVMFEILGQHRPERARTAPPDVHRDTVAYLDRWVLSSPSRREPAPEGIYTAKR